MTINEAADKRCKYGHKWQQVSPQKAICKVCDLVQLLDFSSEG